jgi:class 3 adenylate cyclase
VEFASIVDALRCAAEMQTALANSNAALPLDRRIEFRIGINVGDIVVEDETSLVTASTSWPGSRHWPNRAASACRRGCRKTRRVA